jgi:hypothetical protein
MVLGVAAVFVLAGCASTIYETIAVTNNPIGSKVGEVDVTEGGAYQAAKNGGITQIATVELRTTTGFGSVEQVYVVTGE